MSTNKRKKITLILAGLILIIAVLHLVVFIFLNVSGKNLLQNYIKDNFSAEAQISSVSFRFPFTVVVKDFKCNDVEFSKAHISLGLFNPFGRSISLRKVYIDDLNLKIKIEKDKFTVAPLFVKETVKVQQPPQVEVEAAAAAGSPQKSKQGPFSIKMGKFLVNNASAQVLDLTRDKPVTFNLKNIDIALRNFVYPRLSKFYLEMSASLEKDGIESENIIMAKGWADYSRRNMDIKFNINSAEYIMFNEYYPPFWKPDNLGVKEAKLSLDSKINSVNNDLVIEAVLALDKIEFKEEMQNNSRVNSLKTMLAFFRGEGGKPVLPVKLRTKMDSFHIDFAALQSEFKGKMKLDIGTIVINILNKAKGKTEEATRDIKEITVDKAVDVTKEGVGVVKDVTVDKTAETIKGVMGIIGGIIKSQKEEKSAQQPAQETELSEQPAQLDESQTQAKSEENIQAPAPAEQPQPIVTQEQSTSSSPQANTQVQAQDAQVNIENQNQAQPEQ